MIADTNYFLAGAAVPPAAHPLGGTQHKIYVIESNRQLDLDRILVLTAP